MSDNEVINNILNVKTNDFKIFIEKYQQIVFCTCIGYVHNENDANDLTQDTFVKAYTCINLNKMQNLKLGNTGLQ